MFSSFRSLLYFHFFFLFLNFFLCRPDGQIFEVARENVQEDIRPKKGDIVSFTYDGLSRGGIPVHTTIYRIRTDVSWRELVLEAHADSNTGNDVEVEDNRKRFLNGILSCLFFITYFICCFINARN
jgi:hypothetical protein